MKFFEDTWLTKAREFIGHQPQPGAPEPDRLPLIAYHGDGDGCTSAYFVHRFLKRPARFYWVATPDFDFASAESHILEHHPGLVIFLDMPVYNRPSMIQKLTDQGIRVFIYDHHYPGTRSPVFAGSHGLPAVEECGCPPKPLDRHSSSVGGWRRRTGASAGYAVPQVPRAPAREAPLCDGSPNLLYINPVKNRDAPAYPTCLFGWELLEERTLFEKQVLYIGLYTETWLERVLLFQDFPPGLQERLKEVAKRIHGSFLVQEASTTHHALNFLLKAQARNTLEEDPDTLSEHQALSNIHDLIQHEKTWLMREVSASIRKLIQPKYILIRVDSRIRVCGIIASELRWKYPHLVVGIWQRWKDRLICELRRGIDCPIDLASLIDGIKAEIPLLTGGGHPEAAAFAAGEEAFFPALKKIKTQLAEGKRV